MLFAEVVATSSTVAATSSRTAKRDAISELLQRLDPDEVPVVVGFLVGAPRQGRIGVGWRTFDGAASTVETAQAASVEVSEVDALLTELAVTSGPGSAAARRQLLVDLLGRSTPDEVSFLARLVGGELRQGSSQGVMTDAIAAASGAPLAVVRRGVMLGGDLPTVAATAMSGGRTALEGIGLELGRPLQPMLASTAASATEAVDAIGESSVEWKLDGIRIQVHRRDDEVRIWSRNLNELTDRLPDVVEVVRSLPLRSAVLDGEAIGIDLSGRPVLFQDTVSRRGGDAASGDAASGDASAGVGPDGARHGLRPYFFDLVHLDGIDLIDVPLADRRDALHRIAADWAVPSELTADPLQAEQVLAEALDAGHEGVVVKAAASPYEAGRRGKAWRKVKPVHTLDLVVLGAEWGHGRRRGWLSNLHLGARTAEGAFVMVGKTFKGLTDEILVWQTERFLELAGDPAPTADPPPTGDSPVGTVLLPPVQVVEIAVDGVQRSTRYPGGVALRFARVVRYRSDKDAAQADAIETVQALLGGPAAATASDAD
ncbi:MAG: ATP-dependent DNA ligase [Microthrixaceae bacterium]